MFAALTSAPNSLYPRLCKLIQELAARMSAVESLFTEGLFISESCFNSVHERGWRSLDIPDRMRLKNLKTVN